MDISTADLRSFITVVDMGSFSEAAFALNISQPALTRRIQKLEEQLGVHLLDRNTRQVSLSVVGRDFIPRARYLIEELDSSLLSVREIAERISGQVTIACIPTAAFFFLPEVIREFASEFPRIRVRIIDEGANLVLRSVLQGEADLGINLIGHEEPEIEFEPLLREPFVLACLPDHPLAEKRQVRWEELRPYRLITAARTSGNRLLIDQKLAGLAERPRSVYEVQHLTTSLGMVQSGLGVAALPSMALPRARSSPLTSRPLIDPVIERTVGITRRRNGTLSPAAAEFHRILKSRWRTVSD
ncbi:LysR family transcriptional regulator [Frigidibacter sp. MR17.14]|uniref:LysR family transcriptional regulator n=1 Tax=Frigidibacter sp. MR17.14 TaxID=3126509 RepID=UPI003012A0C3